MECRGRFTWLFLFYFLIAVVWTQAQQTDAGVNPASRAVVPADLKLG